MKHIAGQIENFATEEELQEWSFALSKTDPVTVGVYGSFGKHNDCHGVDENHMFYAWFMDNIFHKIITVMKDPKLVPTFGMYSNQTKPWFAHTDGYHSKNNPNRIPAISFLMPLSVDNDHSLVDKSRTIVFDQCRDTNTQEDIDSLDDQTQDPNSALNIYDEHLSHDNKARICKLTVQGQYQWSRGSLIWWQGRYFHGTDNFIANGYASKQALVVHTHYEV